tara:strand:+ start:6026 stop:7915 length:1890 start_codon:yes stop_codon:yes gene_type:complete
MTLRTIAAGFVAALLWCAFAPTAFARSVDELANLVATVRNEGDSVDPAVFEAIANLDTPEAVTALIQATGTLKSARRRDQAYFAARLFHDAAASERARAWLQDEALRAKDEFRSGAITALLEIGEAAILDLGHVLSNSADARARTRIATPLAPFLMFRGDDAGLELALRLAAFDAPTRVAYLGLTSDQDDGFDALSHHAVMLRVLEAVMDAGRTPAIERFAVDRTMPRRARLILLGLLVRTGTSSVLGEVLADPDPSIVLAALSRLANDGELAAHLDRLGKLHDHADASVRRQAILCENHLRSDEVEWRDELVKLAKSKDQAKRMAAAVALATNGDPRALDKLHNLLKDKEWSVRAEAYRATVAARRIESVPLLIGRMDKEEGRLVDDVHDALRLLTGLDHGRSAKRWKDWWRTESKTFVLPESMYAETAEFERRESVTPNQYKPGDFYGIPVTSRAICFVLDISGSMEEPAKVKAGVSRGGSGAGPTKLDVAKDQLSRVLAKLPEGILYEMVFFGSGVEVEGDGLRKMAKRARAESIRYVRGRQAMGATAIYDGLKRAFEDPDVDTIYLMSDGAPTMGEINDEAEIRAEVARWNAARHIRIHCISVDRDSEMMRGLSQDSGGRYVHIK